MPAWVPIAIAAIGWMIAVVWERYGGPDDPDSPITERRRGNMGSPNRKGIMREYIVAAVRTGVQSIVAIVVATLAGFDIFVDANALTVVLTGIGVSIVTLALRWIESNTPDWVTRVLSLGVSSNGPTYNG